MSSLFSVKAISGTGEFAQLGELLDQCFELPLGNHYFDDFPVWDPQFGVAQAAHFGSWSGSRLIASASIRKAKMRTVEGLLEVALLGGVCTGPDWRGKGIASQVIGRAIQWARSQQCHWILLWGSEMNLYQKYGFRMEGEQVQIPLESLDLESPSQSGVREGWVPGIFPLLQNRQEGLLLTEKDQVWYSAHRNVQWYITGSPQKPEAYAAIGRGIDLKGVVHEWGGNPEQLRLILETVRRAHPGSVLLASPQHLPKLRAKLPTAGIESLCQALYLGRNLKAVFPRNLWVWGLDAC